MQPPLRRLVAVVLAVLAGTAWTVSGYLESRRPQGLEPAQTVGQTIDDVERGADVRPHAS